MNSATNNVPFFMGNWRLGSDQSEVQLPSDRFIASQPPYYRREYSEASLVGTEGDMGSAGNNLSLVPRYGRSNSGSFVHVPNSNARNRPARATLPRPDRPIDTSGSEPEAWRLFEERVRTGPYGLNRFPSHPFSPMRVIVLNGDMARAVNPMLRQFIQQSPPRIRNQWQMHNAPQEDGSRSTQAEDNDTLKKMKKKIYSPKSRSRRWSIYYRDNASSKTEEQIDEDGKRCAICLEDFFANEEVLVTPCNHMFHEECIGTWLKDNGQCPVCRFAISDRRTVPQSNINATLAADDLVSLVRAMEEAFEWLNVPH
ncbi:hypothetical protein Sjap_000568 [Stephania japonica]|uniref:RING-type E3 ubiquitin transferase n=1 Tax=Stephania japonica TaxID=461633 RepID=A0AAP0KIA6_9MAGN